MDKAIIGIDIGGTHFRVGTVSADDTVSGFRKLPVKQVFSTKDPLSDLAGFLKDYIRGREVEAIAIGFPATLDDKRKTVLQAPNVAFMENLPVVETLERELNLPVFIERDVTMALYYDCRKYRVPNHGIVCGIYFGTGIGNAISIHGVPLVGRHGTAGELGHIPADGSDVVCGCGNVGCMEPLAGGRYLAWLHENVFPDTPIHRLFTCHRDSELLRRFIDRMAITVATEINILDPDHILIGGGVPAMADFPQGLLLERIRFHTRKPFPAEDLRILFVEDMPEKSVIGAAICGREKRGKS